MTDLELASTWRPHTTTDAGAEKAAEAFRDMNDGTLFMDNCDLISLPSELGQCQDLKALMCPYNQLVELPPELGQCQALELIFCVQNQLVTLPPELGQCQTLTNIYCNHNPLTEFEGPDKENPVTFLKEQWASRPVTKFALKGKNKS